MGNVVAWERLAAVAVLGAAGGWLAHSRPAVAVHAAENYPGNATYELQGTGPDAQLSVYDGTNRTISVYQGVGSGADVKGCSYQFQLGRPGAPVRRVPCAIGTLQ